MGSLLFFSGSMAVYEPLRISRRDFSLTLSIATTVRRWIAMLCIALFAFAVVGHIHTASARSAEVSYDVSSTLGDQGGSNETLPGAEHCCCAHPVSADTADHGVSVPAYRVSVTALLSDDGAPTGVRDGPERPPRTTAS